MTTSREIAYCAPEQAGVPSAAIEKYMRALASNNLEMHGLVMLRHGKRIYEAYWKPFGAEFMHRLYSSSKSFVAVAVGLAADMGYLSLDDKCLSYFPDRAPENPHPYLADMSIRDLLRMASCWTKGSNYTNLSPDWIDTFFTDEISHAPGALFSYCTSATTMLCCIIKRATGKQFLELLRPVFDAIGIGEAYCIEAPVGGGEYVEWGGSGVIMTINDFAKFADLCMNYGDYNGKRLLPEAFMREATRFQIDNWLADGCDNSARGYGYQFWLFGDNAFAMCGMGGQYALCMPDEGLVIATTGYDELNKDGRLEIFRALKRELLPALSDAPLAPDLSAHAALMAFTDTLALPAAPGKTDAPARLRVNGQTYIMDKNPMGITKTRFTFDMGAREGAWEYENATGAHTLSFGLGKHIYQKFPEKYNARKVDKKAGDGFACHASAGWAGDDTLNISVHVADICMAQLRVSVCFKGDTVNLLGKKHAEWFLDEFSGFASGRRLS